MKISAKFYEEADKAPASATLLRILGVLQFIGAAFSVTTISALLGPGIAGLGLVIGLFLGVSASFTWFVLARIISDLHAIRCNTEAYTVEHDKSDARMLSRAIDALSGNIENIIFYANHPETRSAETAPETPQPEDNDPFDDFDWQQ